MKRGALAARVKPSMVMLSAAAGGGVNGVKARASRHGTHKELKLSRGKKEAHFQ